MHCTQIVSFIFFIDINHFYALFSYSALKYRTLYVTVRCDLWAEVKSGLCRNYIEMKMRSESKKYTQYAGE